ncbi:MAG: hypothetical protein KQJ78_15955 [Deltaproteobacteria bacterium]|nr:hypothetical protein [Deltaproteobacteria bacterium]
MQGQGTGACGINCLTCGLFRQGVCSPCGSGTEEQGQLKLAAQLKLLGGTCAILQCATNRKLGYCSADCAKYPCVLLLEGGYPLSRGYLEMQLRRRGRGNAPPPTPPGKKSLH